MLISEILETWYRQQLNKTVFDVLAGIPSKDPSFQQIEVLQDLVMFVTANAQRPGIMHLRSFYSQDNRALLDELKRLATIARDPSRYHAVPANVNAILANVAS